MAGSRRRRPLTLAHAAIQEGRRQAHDVQAVGHRRARDVEDGAPALGAQHGARDGVGREDDTPADFFVEVIRKAPGDDCAPDKDLRNQDLDHHQPGQCIDPADMGFVL